MITWIQLRGKKRKAIPATGRGGPLGCGTSRLLHILDNRLTDNGEVVSLTCRSTFAPEMISGAYFCYKLSRPRDHSAARRIRLIEKSNDLIGNQTRDLPACSIVPQPTALPRAPYNYEDNTKINLGYGHIARTSSMPCNNIVTVLLHFMHK
jgi:hypothetical protein